jgi:hypothetical protein
MECDALKLGSLGNLLPPLSGILQYTKITTLQSRRPNFA